jgi:hypothetical protein
MRPMRNPGRSEQDAFRFLLFVLVTAVPVAIAASLGSTWLALTLLALTLAFVAVRALRPHPPHVRLKSAPAHVGAADERRILVVANDTLGEDGLARELERLASLPRTHVRVLVPALVSRRARWTSVIDRAHEEAKRRVDAALLRVPNTGTTGQVSDAEPLQAIEDTLITFPADQIVVATRREAHGEGLEPRLADFVRARFAVPVERLVFEPLVRDGGRA